MRGNNVQVGAGARKKRTIVDHLIDQLTDTEETVDQRLQEVAPVGAQRCHMVHQRVDESCCHSLGVREKEPGAGRPSILQHGLIALEDAL